MCNYQVLGKVGNIKVTHIMCKLVAKLTNKLANYYIMYSNKTKHYHAS